VVEPLGNGRYLVSGIRDSGLGIRTAVTAPGEHHSIAYAAVDRGRTWVFMAGRTYVIEGQDRDGSSRTRPTDDHLALSAPMPATVIAVKVAPGQEVQEGDLLITLEAMKMELPIKAPHAGRVKSIACREGELVQAGVPLLELE
jgi:acetyl-CoA/propionyl-CoA carboxylase biotin carboxyl carrier protein